MATVTTKITFAEGAAAATPAAGRVVQYAKADGLFYSKDDTGTETALGGGGGGGLAHSFVGYNTVGGTWTTAVDQRYYLKQVTLAADSLITSIDVHIRPSTDNFSGLFTTILTDNAGAPDVVIAGAGLIAAKLYLSNSSSMPGAARWFSTPSGCFLAAGTYWFGVQPSSTNFDIANDAGADKIFTAGGASGHVVTGAYPTAWAVSDSTRSWSIRASILS